MSELNDKGLYLRRRGINPPFQASLVDQTTDGQFIFLIQDDPFQLQCSQKVSLRSKTGPEFPQNEKRFGLH